MVIHNEIFDTYRIRKKITMQQKLKKINDAVDFLTDNNYTVIDPNGKILNKKINEEKEELSSNNER
jgi:hypothetical protein